MPPVHAPIHRITPMDVFQFAGPLQKLLVVGLILAMAAAVVVLIIKLSEGRRLSGGSAFLSGLRLGALTSSRLIQEVGHAQPWAGTTVKTLLGRLVQKGAVKAERIDGVVRYTPLLSRDGYVEAEIRDLVERLFEGDEAALLARLQARSSPLGGSPAEGRDGGS